MNRKIFLFLILILAIITGISYLNYRKQTFSKEILKLEILGPETAAAGQEIEYTLKYKNNGNVRLENLSLVFEYPEKSLLSPDQQQRINKNLDDLYPGQEQIIKFQARLFGKQGEIKTAKTSIRYQPKNLKAFYESESGFSTKIEEVAISFSFDFPSKIVAGKESEFSINYFSNLDAFVSDLRIKMDYPEGFEFISSDPVGIEKNEWAIPLLNKAEGGRIKIVGRISGDVGSQKIFRANLGIWLNGEFVYLKEIQRGIEITMPRLAIFQQINGMSDYTANPGELLHYEIFFRNIGSEPLENLFLVSQLSGPVDFNTINLERGRASPQDKSIVWDWREVSSLQFLAPAEEGKVEFWIGVKQDWDKSDFEPNNSLIKNEISLSQVKEEFKTKINSKLVLEQKGYFRENTFSNSGPIPPKVGEQTTYTIIWQVKNLYNNITNAKVQAKLPSNVKLTGNISPEEEKSKFTFDSNSREAVWYIGDLTTQVDNPQDIQKSLAFQISFVPNYDQRGLTATLINEAEIVGEDQFTELTIMSTSPSIDTGLPDDDTVSPQQGIVE